MATQRMTVAKVGGAAAERMEYRFRGWDAARRASDPNEWDPEQWPSAVRREADAFVERLRRHALVPPVVHYVEWSDLWSMGDVFFRWLTPPDGPGSLCVYTDQFEVHGYGLPDSGRLRRHLASAGPQWCAEYDAFVSRLHEAVVAWEALVDRAIVIVVREVVGGLVTDEELTASLATVPEWLAGY